MCVYFCCCSFCFCQLMMSLYPHLQYGWFLFGILSANETEENKNRNAEAIDPENFHQSKSLTNGKERRRKALYIDFHVGNLPPYLYNYRIYYANITPLCNWWFYDYRHKYWKIIVGKIKLDWSGVISFFLFHSERFTQWMTDYWWIYASMWTDMRSYRSFGLKGANKKGLIIWKYW